MRVLVTGATGFVGSEVVRQLIAAGHEPTGLARSEKSAAALVAAGARVLQGDLSDTERLSAGAGEADGVIHCGFIHDFNKFAVSVDVDKRAIEALAAGRAGSDRPLIVTSGTAGLSLGRPSTEDDAPNPNVYEGSPRVSEQTGLAQGGNVMVMRLPPSVHGEGDHGFIHTLINIARDKGVSGYVGEGTNRWPAVHRADAARAYVLALEKGDAGTRYHAVAEEGIAFCDIAAIIGQKLGLPVASVPQAQAAEHFGWMARFAAMDVPASSQLTTARLGWKPTGSRLMDDLESGSYFTA